MNFKRLRITTGIVLISFLSATTSCNNETGNNSTVETVSGDSTVKTGDTTQMNSMNPSDSTGAVTMSATKRKKGKASVKMASDANTKVEKDQAGYYTSAEVQPTYNGGQSALEDYVNNNIEYPQQAIDNNVEGTVSVHFLIDENGKITNVSTVGNKIGYGLEEEAIRVVSKMPQWSPGKVKGKSVKTWRTLPIMYKLDES